LMAARLVSSRFDAVWRRLTLIAFAAVVLSFCWLYPWGLFVRPSKKPHDGRMLRNAPTLVSPAEQPQQPAPLRHAAVGLAHCFGHALSDERVLRSEAPLEGRP
jgi:hypothetical protein